MKPPALPPATSLQMRVRLRWEIAIVLALSFGASGVYAIVNIVERLTRETALSSQTATINRPLAERAGFDLTYQLLGFAFGLAPVALVIYLLWQQRAPHLRALGLGATWPGSRAGVRAHSLQLPGEAHIGKSNSLGASGNNNGIINSGNSGGNARRGSGPWWLRETGGGFLLAAAIGIPGLGFYLFAKEIGINTTVVPAALDTYWWTVPVLVLQALRAALGEELIVVAYLFDRLKRLGVGTVGVILSSALLRGSYHLYQGFGGFIGNVVMGLVFGWCYHRWGRTMPLIVAHWILDIVSFVGYALAVAWWPELFGAPTAQTE